MIDSTQESAAKKKSDPTLRDLLAPLFRRKRVFVLTFCGVLIGSGVAAFFLGSQHKAKMEILVNQERLEPTVTSEGTPQAASAPPAVTDEQINSEVELLNSPDLLERVVKATGLDEIERKRLVSQLLPKQDAAWYLARATDHLSKKLDIEQVTKSDLIEIDYKSSDPQLAYSVLQTLGNFYLEKHLAVNRPNGSYGFFSAQAEKYREALEDAEARLADFSRTAGVSTPDLERTYMAQQLVDSIAALYSTQQAVAAERQRIEDEEARIKATPDRSPTQQVSDSAQALLQQLQAGLLAAQVKRTQLAMKYDPSYPLVQEADQEIAETQSAISAAEKQQYINQTVDRDPTYELIREDIAKTRADLAAHQASAYALGNSIRSFRTSMSGLDQKAIQQADLMREVKTDEANYLLYVSKREQERTSDALDERRIANVAIAVPPILPILPWISPLLVMLIGIVLAAFIAAGVAFVAEYLNPFLRTPDEVLEVLRIPVLASVPKQVA